MILCEYLTAVSLDTSYTLPVDRLKNAISSKATEHASQSNDLSGFHHFSTPSLPFLLAILCQSAANFPPPQCSLLVIDSLSNVYNAAFSKAADGSAKVSDKKQADEARQWASKRRWAILEEISQRLQKLAAVNDIAILIINQAATRLRLGIGVLLQSALSSQAFENCVKNRVVTYRDWFDEVGVDYKEDMSTYNGAMVMKANGLRCRTLGRMVVFEILKVGERQLSGDIYLIPRLLQDGIQEIERTLHKPEACPETRGLPASSGRRVGEIADSQSEGEDGYGSDEEFELDEPDLLHEKLCEI